MDINRVKWASRRGMLELDLLLGQFVEHEYESLSPEEQTQYQTLLENEDQDLFNWLIHRHKPDSAETSDIIELIRTRHYARG